MKVNKFDVFAAPRNNFLLAALAVRAAILNQPCLLHYITSTRYALHMQVVTMVIKLKR